MVKTLYTGISQLVTASAGPKHGQEMQQLDVLENAALMVNNGQIEWLGPIKEAPQANQPQTIQQIDFGGRAVIPGLIDPHTHAVWAGDRLADFEAKVKGVPYEDILAAGGGIRRTMRDTAAASLETLVKLARPRLQALTTSGATTIEVKSGYGLDFKAELKMLRAIQELKKEFELVATLLIHVPPTEGREQYVTDVCQKLIPQVAKENLANAVDVFCEKEAFTVAETQLIFEAAQKHSLHIKLHADQFHAIGGTELACQMDALSVDHLEASQEAQITALAKSKTIATILPGVTLHLGLPPAPGRKLIDAGAAVAIGTDANPGSSPLLSTQLALALAVRLCGLTPAEALTACTVNAAAALGLKDRGSLQVGQRADWLVLDSPDWRDVTYCLGKNPYYAVASSKTGIQIN